MKILFLDFDGVLNSWQSVYWEKRHEISSKTILCPIAMSNLDELMKVTPNLRIVVSSTWRKYIPIDDLKKILSEQGFKSAERIIDYTIYKQSGLKFSQTGERWGEIKEWLDEHPEVTQWAIVDDNKVTSDPNPTVEARLVRTDPRVGLDWYKTDALRAILGGHALKEVSI